MYRICKWPEIQFMDRPVIDIAGDRLNDSAVCFVGRISIGFLLVANVVLIHLSIFSNSKTIRRGSYLGASDDAIALNATNCLCYQGTS